MRDVTHDPRPRAHDSRGRGGGDGMVHPSPQRREGGHTKPHHGERAGQPPPTGSPPQGRRASTSEGDRGLQAPDRILG